MRLIVARCAVSYSGRLSTTLPMAVRLLVLKADGSLLVHADSGGYKPLNWMTPPTAIEIEGDPPERIEVRKLNGSELLEVTIEEVLADISHEADTRSAREGRSRARPAGAAGRASCPLRRGVSPRAPRVADRHQPG